MEAGSVRMSSVGLQAKVVDTFVIDKGRSTTTS